MDLTENSAITGGAGDDEAAQPSDDARAARTAQAAPPAEALLIGGRAGVGKSTAAWEVSELLRAADVGHAVVEGDFMGAVHPAPPGDPHRSAITARNLAAVWAHYAESGCRRLVYTNTVSVLPESAALFTGALGPDVRLVRVLLTASDDTAARRLTGRELGSGLAAELARSLHTSRLLAARSADGTVRIATDGRTVADIARDVVAATGWAG
jgi:hypothetical protein